MVVFDYLGNGYREVILPLANENELVRRAICVVAAHHLANDFVELKQAAAVGQMSIISKLRRDAAELGENQVFNIYSWVTILILLVGETITGGQDFVYLLEMLMCLEKCFSIKPGLPSHKFLLQQTQM